MTTLIKEELRTEHGVYVTAESGKTSATVGITKYGVQVVCHNAAHRVWRGAGRHFENMEAAKAGYKSADMHAILNTAAAINEKSAAVAA